MDIYGRNFRAASIVAIATIPTSATGGTVADLSAVPPSTAAGVLFLSELRCEVAGSAHFNDDGNADIALSFQCGTSMDRISRDNQMGGHQIYPIVRPAGACDRLYCARHPRGVVGHRVLVGGNMDQSDDQFGLERH